MSTLKTIHEAGESLVSLWVALFRGLGMHAHDNRAVVKIAADLIERVDAEAARVRGPVILHTDGECIFLHREMVRFGVAGYVRARNLVEWLAAVQRNEVIVPAGLTPLQVTETTAAWRAAALQGAASASGDARPALPTDLPITLLMVPSHAARAEGGARHRGDALDECTALRVIVRTWNASARSGRVGAPVVSRRILQRLIDHAATDFDLLVGVALQRVPDGPDALRDRASSAALLAAALGVVLGLRRGQARGAAMAALYLALDAPDVSFADELELWNQQFGLPAADEWLVRDGVDAWRLGVSGGTPCVEALLGGFALGWVGARARLGRETSFGEALSELRERAPAFARVLGDTLRARIVQPWPGTLAEVDGEPAMIRARREIVVLGDTGRPFVRERAIWHSVDDSLDAPASWFGFDAWPEP